MLLDVRTAVMLAMLIAGLLAAVLAASVAGYPRELRQPLQRWALALALQALGWGLFGLRGSIGDFFSIPVANLLLVLAFVATLRALRSFAGRGEAHPLDAAAVGLVALGSLVFLYAVPLLWVRIAISSLVFGVLFAECCRMVLAAAPPPRPRSHHVLAALYAALVLLMVARVGRELFGATPLLDPLQPTPFQGLLFAVGALAPALATFGFILMVNERLRGELTRRAALDPLTATYNRRTLAELAGRGIAQARREGGGFGVLLLDVDHFKRINDTLGHAAGDDALQRLVGILREGLRAQDTLGRMGGEEFIVLLPATDAPQALVAAERLRAAVERARPVLSGMPWPMTVSIGVASLSGEEDFESLLRRADAAMYVAKRDGRNRVVACAGGAAGKGGAIEARDS
jgi:diguanylate cyclase (GGDEF)-like protein